MDLDKLHEDIVAQGGQVIAISSEPYEKAREGMKKWKLRFAHQIGDPTQKLAKYLREKKLLDLVITGHEGDEGYDTTYFKVHPKMGKYKHGCAQPALLLVADKPTDKLYSWHIDPKTQNLGGASDRPVIGQVWDFAKKKLADRSVEEPEMSLISKLSARMLYTYFFR